MESSTDLLELSTLSYCLLISMAENRSPLIYTSNQVILSQDTVKLALAHALPPSVVPTIGGESSRFWPLRAAIRTIKSAAHAVCVGLGFS
jgi:hypothetical protein